MGVVLGWQWGNGLVEEALLPVSPALFQKEVQNWAKFYPQFNLYESSPLQLLSTHHRKGMKEEMTKKEQQAGESEWNH